eukprot:2714732-Lingulodinium_polyedra.AAC.1
MERIVKHKCRNCMMNKNLNNADVYAMKWLKNNRDIIIDAPADKNLGCVILPTEAYDDLAHKVLNKSFMKISYEALIQNVHE